MCKKAFIKKERKNYLGKTIARFYHNLAKFGTVYEE